MSLKPYPYPDVVKAISEHRSGSATVAGDTGTELVFYNRMNSTGWYYAVAGPEDEILAITDDN